MATPLPAPLALLKFERFNMSDFNTSPPVETAPLVSAPLLASLRYVGTFLGGAITLAAGFGTISPEVAHKLTGTLPALVDGLTTEAGAISALASIVLGAYGAWTVTRKQRIAAVAADPHVSKVVTTPELAGAIPSPKVVSR